jgi:hypothetical protein
MMETISTLLEPWVQGGRISNVELALTLGVYLPPWDGGAAGCGDAHVRPLRPLSAVRVAVVRYLVPSWMASTQFRLAARSLIINSIARQKFHMLLSTMIDRQGGLGSAS